MSDTSTRYTEEEREKILETIFYHMSNDGMSVRKIFRDNLVPINKDTFYYWMDKYNDKGYSDRYIQARLNLADNYLDKAVDEMDDCEGKCLDNMGRTKDSNVMVNLAKSRADIYLKYVEKVAPYRYGPKQNVEHSGSIKTTGDVVDTALLSSFLSSDKMKELGLDDTE